MYKTTYLSIFILLINFLQAFPSGLTPPDTIYNKVEEMPSFPGGEDSLMKFLSDHIKYPVDARSNSISGRVYASFVVNRDGKINNIKILRGIGGGCDEEVVRVLKLMPDWKPGILKGERVSVQYNLPVNFNLKKEPDDEWLSKASFYMKAEKYDEAIIAYDEALKINPKNSYTFYNRGNANHKLKKNKKACDDWERAKELGNTKAEEKLKEYCGN